ncbi:Vesicle tethering protein Uso1/P115-like [Macleaya cordata]|uniref:Vesicle tethering protein Uso1/P115-like n=1 Tax=Macleaya cordata TaxID=56857 RepID=A0A200QEM7_MACCD|nr:Vesicle tethering protein Uso1/P115-like [Macleaya cordata]
MDFKLGRINLNKVAQGVGGLVFGKDTFGSSDDSYVQSLLERIRNGVKAEDKIAAIDDLQSVVEESASAQLAFGATGISVLMGILKEERDNLEMVQSALETLVSALTPIDPEEGLKNEIQPTVINSDLLSRDEENISLLINLLEEDGFNVRYYTLQLLTALLAASPNRLQEAILTIPHGITRLMDTLMNREALRNEALLLLTYLTSEAEEIQKIVVFEGAFEKIFTIIQEEGGAEGGVVVQDCLELLNNLLNSASNQILLRETTGFEPLISILKLGGNVYKFSKQKTVNLLRALEAIKLLLVGGLETDPGRDSNRLSNQTVLFEKKVMDYLLMLGVENQWAAVALRCSALQCIGYLVVGHLQNLDAFASKVLGEEPNVEPALNSILRILLRTSSAQEFVAADFVFKCFCENNTDGQAMLASTMIPQPHSMTHAPLEEDINMSFGSMLLHGLTVSETDGDLETCCRAANVLSHILMDNIQCKERVLRIELEAQIPSLGAQEPLMHRIIKYLALSSMKKKDGNHKTSTSARVSYIQPVILKLLVTWLADFPDAVHCFLVLRPHLTYLLELVSSLSVSVCTKGLAAVLLGECFLYNKPVDKSRDASMVVDAINEKVGITSYLLKLEEMQKSFIFVSAKPGLPDSVAGMEDFNDNDETDWKHDEHPVLMSLFHAQFVSFVKKLEENIRENIVEVCSHPRPKVTVLPVELEQKSGEGDGDYIKRLKSFVERQCAEMQDLLGRNATSAKILSKTSGSDPSGFNQGSTEGREKVQTETLFRDLQEALQRVEMLKSEKAKIEAEASRYRNVAGKMESDLKSLTDAYKSLEQRNFQLESEVKISRKGKSEALPDLEAIKAEAKEEAMKESEVELSDLLVCLGQEQTKVEKLSARLVELGENVSLLLEGVGDDIGMPEDVEDDED